MIASVYKDGDHVWVHDYQLMQVPQELRQRFPNCRVAWFLHTPFPSSEIYRILPVRKPLLQVMRTWFQGGLTFASRLDALGTLPSSQSLPAS